MQKRKSHHKSRAGCHNCKNRHVKCDEQGPPCANCVVRGAIDTCTYSSSLRSSSTDQASSGCRCTSETPPGDLHVEQKQLLKLELMHRWSVETYKSFSGVADDDHYLQVILPQYSFQHEFLLHGILAVAALDIAASESDRASARCGKYSQITMEYYDKASVMFRKQLDTITQDNIHYIYMFSVMAMCINMAITQCSGGDEHATLLDRVPLLLELSLASTSFFTKYPEWMLNSPLSKSIQAASLLIYEPKIRLDATVEKALATLESVVRQSVLPTNLAELETYRNTISGLRTCYMEDTKDLMKGFCIAFPTLAGRNFAAEVGDMKPVALLILLHWAISLHRFGTMAWWARSVGMKLVQETSVALEQRYPELVLLPEWRSGILWGKKVIGVPEYW
ncbi:hypothetical protein BJ878DRAFT_574111 [Calycina marina]|uniref:Zn(2)-C6 fungal-type domain-containing protein n=1 Tax=Calycina marina TaxID=1763456 RepID=A0A9P8CGL4_9HELO|nr:hypothetical protein BJ878DRAFT_574111 [Calycina marina]